MYTPSDLIKITHEHNCSYLSNSDNSSDSNEFSKHNKFRKNKNFSEQQHNTPQEDDASPGDTAVAAVMMAESIKSRSSKKVPTKKFESY